MSRRNTFTHTRGTNQKIIERVKYLNEKKIKNKSSSIDFCCWLYFYYIDVWGL